VPIPEYSSPIFTKRFKKKSDYKPNFEQFGDNLFFRLLDKRLKNESKEALMTQRITPKPTARPRPKTTKSRWASPRNNDLHVLVVDIDNPTSNHRLLLSPRVIVQ
jgi:hypothetical protein